MKKIIWFLMATSLVVLSLATTPVVADAPPPGCNGTIKTHNGAGEPTPIEQDHPKVGCSFHLHGFNFDPGSTVYWNIKTQPGGVNVLSGSLVVDANGEVKTGLLSLPDSMYKVYWHQVGCPGGDKHKVFKTECTPPPPVCVNVEEHEETTWNPWPDECVDGLRTRTGTYHWWTTDVGTGETCEDRERPVSEQERCGDEYCQIVDEFSSTTCTDLTDCIDGWLTRECVHEEWSLDRKNHDIKCSYTSSVKIERVPCGEEPKECPTPGYQQEMVVGPGPWEIYQIDHVLWSSITLIQDGDETYVILTPIMDEDGYVRSNYQIPGPCPEDSCKQHFQVGIWKYAESVHEMLEKGRLDPYGQYWMAIFKHDNERGWVFYGLIRFMTDDPHRESYPVVRYWPEGWQFSFDHPWYQVIVAEDVFRLGLD